MYKKSADLSWPLPGGVQTVLERTLVAEYLLSKGYLASDLKELPPQVAKNLVAEAWRFATRKLSELGLIKRYQFRMLFSLN